MRRSLVVLAASLILVALVPRASSAGALTALEAMSSTVMQQGQSSFSGLGIRARIHPAALIKQVELMPAFEYWRNTSTVHPYGIHAMRKDATLAIDARYTFSPTGWQPYLGAGWALHFLSSSVDAPLLGINDASDSVVKGGLAVLGGVTMGLSGKLDNFFELKYHHIPGFRQLKINWGLSYRL